jgi:hypothetical protein
MITIILPASRIPDGTTVRKLTGTTAYTLQREIKVYMASGLDKPSSIKTEGVVFLVGEKGSINGYADTTKFALDMEEDELLEMLQGWKDDRESN